MINVAFVIDTIESPTAGTEKQLLLLIQHLNLEKFTPYLCVLQSSPWLREKFDICEIFCADIKSFKSWRGICGIGRLNRFFRSKQIDIVQVSFRDASLAGITAARLAGIKTILATRRNQGYWLTRHELYLQKFFDRWVVAFIANSKATKEWSIQTEGLLPQQVHVIYNALDFGVYSTQDDSIREVVRKRLGIASAAKIIGIVANLRPVKGHGVFLHAAAKVCEKFDDVFFLLIGQGEECERLEALVEELGIADRVRFLGRQQNVQDILRAMDIGVLSSHSESFSNALMEYLAAGLPVVCTDVGGVRELVHEGVNGQIVDSGDSIAMGVAMVKILCNLGAYSLDSSREWLQNNCSVLCVVEQYAQLYIQSSDSFLVGRRTDGGDG